MRHVRKAAHLQRRASSRAARGPSIPHARQWVDLPVAHPELRVRGPVSAQGLDLAHGLALVVRRGPAQAVLPLQQRVHVRRARQTSDPVAADSSIRRRRKAR